MFQVAFIDLDDTLFSSLHKHEEVAELQPAALLLDRSVISYSSPEQRALTQWLHASDLVIPVTARTQEAYNRVLLRFCDHAVLSNGATILDPKRKVDQKWEQQVARSLVTELPLLTNIYEKLQAEYGGQGGLNIRIVGDMGRSAYLVAKNPAKDPTLVRQAFEGCVAPWLTENPNFTHHLNGNNLAVLPPSVNKRSAVAYLIKKLELEHGDLFIVGAGDSLTDIPFMSLCHVAIIPTTSQIWDLTKTFIGNK